MKRFKQTVLKVALGLSGAINRFPLAVFCLICATILSCYIISMHTTPHLLVQKLMFTFLLGSFVGVTSQFVFERYWHQSKERVAVYAISIVLILGYFLIIYPVPAINYLVGARTLVAIFSMFCVFIWIPSYKNKVDFNNVALIHFKSAFTSALYAAVLSLGLAAIIGTVDILLFKVNNDWYGYMMSVVWILFATIYYLSLLPYFNSEEEARQTYAIDASHYPRFLEILVSYIAIPLVAAYTLVLLAYFIKIGITMKWPSGQLGPMILAYSAAGLIIFILASRLENRFAILYQKVFPKVLIPIVIMQLISVYLRLNAYGVTESRYYIALFGLFSITVGLVLSFRPGTKNSIIALLAAGFAIFSVIPPVDAFTVSRFSQINRLESMLQEAGVLVNGEIKPKADVDMTLRLETTSILKYLEQRSYLKQIIWLPDDFETDKDMQKTLGYEPAYQYMGESQNIFFANLDMQKPLSIDGYDVLLQVGAYRGMDLGKVSTYDFIVDDVQYQLAVERLTPKEVRLSVLNDEGTELVKTGLYDFASSVTGVSSRPKEALDSEELTLDAESNSCRLRVVFQNISIINGTGADAGADYNMFVLVDIPQ